MQSRGWVPARDWVAPQEGSLMVVTRKSLAPLGILLAASLALSACGGDDNGGTAASASPSASVPQIDAAAFTADVSLMKQLTGLASQGQGKIGVLLPDTTTSTRYVQYDAPYLKQAFEAAGLKSDQFMIQNAQGSASTMQTQADAMMNSG